MADKPRCEQCQHYEGDSEAGAGLFTVRTGEIAEDHRE